MSNEKDARLIWVKLIDNVFIFTGNYNTSKELPKDDVTMVGSDSTTNMEHFYPQFRLVSLIEIAVIKLCFEKICL